MSVAIAKWKLDDYHRMIDVGLLNDRRVELLNGEIVELSPEGPDHAQQIMDIADYLQTRLGDRATIRHGKPITISSSHSEPEPDLAIAQPLGQESLDHHPYPEHVFWLIEVSKISLTKDLTDKRLAYAAAGIKEYWVVDLKHHQLHVFRSPVDGDYRLERTMTNGDINPQAFPDLSVSVHHLLNGARTFH